MESLSENKPLLYALSFAGGMTLFMASEWSPEFNEGFQLVAYPDSFRNTLVLLVLGDFFGSYCVERVTKLLFG